MEKNYIIYKIECIDKEVNYIYIGSTINFVRRKAEHKNRTHNETHNEYTHKKYTSIRENGGWDNFEMKPIEELVCSKRQAQIREQYWIEHFNSNLNCQKAYRTIEDIKAYRLQYKIINESKLKEKRKIYNLNNIENRNIKQKQYRLNKLQKDLENNNI